MRKIINIITITVVFILAGLAFVYFASPGTLYNAGISWARKSAGLTQKSIKVDDHTIQYLEGGKGDNILLVHGFTGEKDNWTLFARYLTPSYHVVALDLPGFGESSRIGSDSYAIQDQANRLDRFADLVGLKTFHIAGNSMGGAIAAKYTVDHPEKVLTLGLFDNAGIWECPEKSDLNKVLEQGGKNPLLSETPKDFKESLKYVFVDPPPAPGRILGYLAEKQLAVKAFNEKVWNDIKGKDKIYQLEPDLPKIKNRTLILWGDTDRLISVSCVGILQKGLVNSQTVIMKKCGHVPMMERPKETAEHYLKFIAAK
ncbi:MAG: alpha/beta hydrolase [bacterium]|nr:alpha/beta hydrolase [bacterium]